MNGAVLRHECPRSQSVGQPVATKHRLFDVGTGQDADTHQVDVVCGGRRFGGDGRG
jgi:hypothetical protein